jgi:hypothetical protein
VKRLALIGSLAILAILIASPAYAISDKYFVTSDLNLIPTTDTLEEGTAEWDLTAAYNEDFSRGRVVFSRTHVALFDNVEFGMLWGINRTAGPVQMGAKWKILDEYEGRWPVSLAVGFDHATGNYQRTGFEPVYYGVIGIHDVQLAGWWDWYLGVASNPVGYDTEDVSLFAGAQYWINEDWQFLADYYGYAENEEFFLTGGLNYDLVKHIELQGWVEYDSVTEDTSILLSFNSRALLTDLTEAPSDPE